MNYRLVIFLIVMVAAYASGFCGLPGFPFLCGAKYRALKRALEGDGYVKDLVDGFAYLDTNGDKFIDRSEIAPITKFFPRLSADAIFAADNDGDGKVSIPEFLAAVQMGPRDEVEER